MRLFLARHSETPTNLERLLDTRIPGPGLTQLGERQARRLSDALTDVSLDAVYASTMLRTQLTAEPLARAHTLDVQIRAGVREVQAGEYEMRGEEWFGPYIDVLRSWMGGDLSRRMPGAESGMEFLDRFDEVVTEIGREGHENAVVISHGAAIRTWATLRCDNLDSTFTNDNLIPNGAYAQLDGDVDKGWRAVVWAGQKLDESGDVEAVIPAAEPASEDKAML